MFKYLLHNRPGRFLLIGTIFLVLGFIILYTGSFNANPFFYISIFFLGFFAAKNAVLSTIQESALNVDLLMVLAALGAVVIDYASEGAMLLFIFALAEVMESFANSRSTASIEELMAQVPDTALRLLPNGETEEVLTDDLVIGDSVVVSRGDQLPIDGITDRETEINEAALTGESVPAHKQKGDEVFAGTINSSHAFHLEVTKNPDETIFSNIIRMVEEAQGRPSRISSFIDRIESKYVIGVLLAVPIFIALLYFFVGLSFQEAFYRGMVFLTVASPCALVASATPATLSAISNGAKNGVLTKGGAAFEALSKMQILYSDKTGTITFGEFKVIDYASPDAVLKEVIYMEQQSGHPIAEALVNHFSDVNLSSVDQSEPVEEIAGIGVQKGDIIVGKPAAFSSYDDPNNYRRKTETSHTVIFAGQNNEIVAFFSLADKVRPSAIHAIDSFQKEGIDVQILTGDNEKVTAVVAEQVGIEHYSAGLMPEDKINYVINKQDKEKMVGMIGDGINDAPALASADIGIAMGSGSSVAMESADVVIVQNDLEKLFHSYKLSQRLNTIIQQNVIFAVGVIAVLIILNLFGLITLPLAVLFHEGSTILVILNGLRLLGKKQEENHPLEPETKTT